ncbi:DUF397 domain-containing protein [Streptosporangium sp. H16]|uniref:DUF397 domain-containing protein n=1 Tax=Streptosporangium sp. H16 TaxID=3444184 RepID=UPI003F7A360D
MGEESGISRAEWHTSSLSGSSGQCVQVAFLDEDVAVRDSKDPNGPILFFTSDEWQTFTGSIRRGKFEIPAS